MKMIFYPPVNTDKPKFVAFLVFLCTTASFIAQYRKCLETRRHLGSGRKTINGQGYSELGEPIKTRARKLLFTDLVNTKTVLDPVM